MQFSVLSLYSYYFYLSTIFLLLMIIILINSIDIFPVKSYIISVNESHYHLKNYNKQPNTY